MGDAHLLLYTSSNGDRWSLCRGERPGDIHVLHEPNASSGGRAARIDLGRFLADGSEGPQQQALLRLIGTLVGQSATAAPAGGPAPEPGASAAEPTPGEALR